MDPRVTVFAGPSVPPNRRDGRGVIFRPPARHGDLWRLAPGHGDVVVIIDGVYQQYAPLRHQELRWAIAQGATIAGAASYGALRAAELRDHGMIPLGRVSAAYSAGSLTSDADVALLHTDDDDCRPMTIALVSIMFAASDLRATGLLSASESEHVCGVGRQLHFTERSGAAMRATTDARYLPAVNRVLEHLAGGGDVKQNDAEEAVRWARDRSPAVSQENRGQAHPRIARWSSYAAEEFFATAPVGGSPDISGRHVLAALQLFDPDFPERHRRYVELSCGVDAAERSALSVLQAAGFQPDAVLSSGYAQPTRATLDWSPATRVLVRTFRLCPGRLTYTELRPEVLGPHDVGALVRWCEEMRAHQFSRNDALSGLRKRWSVSRSEELRLAVLDRGFRNLVEALEWSARFDFAAVTRNPL